jgi:N-acetylgalactosaminide alpha-2,6-sialyltransferase (sialyltransferase 7E)
MKRASWIPLLLQCVLLALPGSSATRALRGPKNASVTPYHPMAGRLSPPKITAAELRCQLEKAVALRLDSLPGAANGRLQSRHRSCAVVSSSGVLSKHAHGSEIDKADLVIRFNDAPLQGFEKVAGSKDDVRFVNDLVARWIRDKGVAATHASKNTTFAVVPINERMVPKLTVLHHAAPNAEVYKVDRSMLNNMTTTLKAVYPWIWFTVGHGPWLAPTTGCVGMLVALRICDEVRAYGMAATKGDDKSPYHYWEPFGKADAPKDHKTSSPEKDVWRRLATNPTEQIDGEDVVVIPGFAQAPPKQCGDSSDSKRA